jgi:aryl-alcohol dehydrogenase-like predicted oxidoreductase
VVEVLQQLARKKGATSSQIALAWLLAQKPWIVPIPGTRRRDYLNENLGSVAVSLSEAELQGLEAAFAGVKVHGGRMNEMQMRIVDRSV